MKKDRIAACGLYCGMCRKFISGKCPGCRENAGASWCKVRACCIGNGYASCADCTVTSPEECGKFNNFISKIFAFIFGSDRKACIRRIKETGYEGYAHEMEEKKNMTIKRR